MMGYLTAAKGNDANCATTFMADLDAFLQANGWSLVETYSPSAVYNVYKSPAAGNSAGVDIYFWATRSSAGATTVYFGLAEGYSAATHYLTRYVPYANGLQPVAASNYTYDPTTGAIITTGSKFTVASVSISATGYTYWMSANANRIIIATRVSTTDCCAFAGATVNMLSTTDLPDSAVSLFVTGTNFGNGSAPSTSNTLYYYGGFTREPGQASAANGNFGGQMQTTGYTSGGWWPFVYTAHTSSDVYKADYGAYRVPIFSQRNGSLMIPRALLDSSFIYVPKLSTASVNGDTVSYNGKTWVRMGIASFPLFVDNAA
jgi:hypothetical protein